MNNLSGIIKIYRSLIVIIQNKTKISTSLYREIKFITKTSSQGITILSNCQFLDYKIDVFVDEVPTEVLEYPIWPLIFA